MIFGEGRRSRGIVVSYDVDLVLLLESAGIFAINFKGRRIKQTTLQLH